MRQLSVQTLALTVATAGAVALAASCADQPTRPSDASAAATPIIQSLKLGDEQRGQLRAALLFAREQSTLALQERAQAEAVTAAFTRLAERVDADDATGTERALSVARDALKRYRQAARVNADGSQDGTVDLTAMDLTLDRATAFVREARAARSEHDATQSQAAKSREEHQR